MCIASVVFCVRYALCVVVCVCALRLCNSSVRASVFLYMCVVCCCVLFSVFVALLCFVLFVLLCFMLLFVPCIACCVFRIVSVFVVFSCCCWG